MGTLFSHQFSCEFKMSLKNKGFKKNKLVTALIMPNIPTKTGTKNIFEIIALSTMQRNTIGQSNLVTPSLICVY